MTIEIPIAVSVYSCILLCILIIAVTCCVIDTVLAVSNYIQTKRINRDKMIETMVGEIVDEKMNPGGGIQSSLF